MAHRRLSTQNLGPISHLPTWLLIIGTAAFWLELFVVRLPGGHTSWLAWGLWLLIACLVGKKETFSLKFRPLTLWEWGMAIFIGVYGLIIVYASLLPPHLPQEHDAINYHLTLPRQHLIHHDFFHLPWSVPDLFLLPLDYALAPFALSTFLPNKIPQLFFFFGCLFLTFYLIKTLSNGDALKAWFGVAAVMASHIFAIQSGTAMLDMVMLYCFLACVHSLLTGRFVLAAIEGSFLFWSKSFIPLQLGLVGIILGIIIFVLYKNKFTLDEKFPWKKQSAQTIAIVFIMASAVIALPHLIRSFYYTGTPLYPFGVGILPPLTSYEPSHWQAIVARANDSLAVKDAYGHGRGFFDCIKHFWLIAVPEKGVNNAFDYPVGLVYLLTFVPFMVYAIQTLRAKKIPVLALIILLWWGTWWFGSQQSRFLMIPLCFMVVWVVAKMPRVSDIFKFLVMAAMLLEIISLKNAHHADWGKKASEVLEPKDRAYAFDAQYKDGQTILKGHDVAFADFPTKVYTKDSIYVIPLPQWQGVYKED